MEYIPYDLKSFLNSVERGTRITEAHIVVILYNLLQAINYLHSANIIHRDLKTNNILINAKCNVKICDFGLSRVCTEVQKNEQNRIAAIRE